LLVVGCCGVLSACSSDDDSGSAASVPSVPDDGAVTTDSPPELPVACTPAEPEAISDDPSGPVTVLFGCPDGEQLVRPALAVRDEAVEVEDILQQRLALVSRGPTDAERAGGYLVSWTGQLSFELRRDDGEVSIDLKETTRGQVVAANGTSAGFFVPLVGTAFLDASVDVVHVTLEGNEAAAAEWWQATDLTWTRAEWEDGL
jgi:hypothetical protein